MELTDMAVLDTHMLDTLMDTHMPMVPLDTMERDPLMLSQRLMLMLLSSMELTDMLDTHMLDTLMDTHMPMVPMDTTERDPLMLSQRLMLMLLSSTELTDMLETHMLDSYGYPYAYGAYGYYGKRS